MRVRRCVPHAVRPRSVLRVAPCSLHRRLALALAVIIALAVLACPGGLFAADAVKKELITEPAPLPKPADVRALAAYPDRVALKGGDDARQLILTATLAGDRLADLSGDVTFAASISAGYTQSVGAGTASTASLVSGPDPSSFGSAVTFTATLSGSGGTPTGTVVHGPELQDFLDQVRGRDDVSFALVVGLLGAEAHRRADVEAALARQPAAV